MFAVATATTALTGCAGRFSAYARETEHSPVPAWLSDAVGCDRAQLDREWTLRRYVPAAVNDSACVALGRMGAPHQTIVSHGPARGSMITIDWDGIPGLGSAHASAVRSDTADDKSDWPTGYFKVWSWGPMPRPPVDTSHTAVIIGSVLDSLGAPLPRGVLVCAMGLRDGLSTDSTRRCTMTTPGGSYRLDSLPPRWVRLSLWCDTRQDSPQHFPRIEGASAERPVGAAHVTLVSFRGCDTRASTPGGEATEPSSRSLEERAFAPPPPQPPVIVITQERRILANHDRARSGCRISLSPLSPSARAHAAGATAPAVIRGAITDTLGRPLEQATVVLAIFRGTVVTRPGAYTSREGRAVLLIPADQIVNADSMVVYARRVGYEPQHAAARIVPGDTVAATAVLCLQRTIKSEFTDVRAVECRGADSEAVRLVRRFAMEHMAFKAEHHMAPIDPGTVRLLTDARDGAMCRRLNAALPTATYVSGGAYYFAVMPRTQVQGANGTWYYPEWRQLAVFDRELNFVGVEGM